MWMATLNFAKAFYTIKYKALCTALAHFGIESHYICLLKRLCVDQKATVFTDKESDMFEINRGTKLLFNTVLCTGRRFGTMARERRGRLSGCSAVRLFLKHTVRGRRAVFLYLFGTVQKYDVRFQEKYRKCRTENPSEKTKILSNQRSNRRKEVTIDNINMEVLLVKERAKDLGQTITEIKSRIRAARHHVPSIVRS